MKKFFKKIFNSDKKLYKKYSEKVLLKKYGKCFEMKKSLDILVISDTHNCLNNNQEILNKLQLYKDTYDICLLLGDISGNDIEIILNYISTEKIYGILGNHDSLDKLDYYDITNIHGSVITINDVKIAGIQGSCKYKEGDYALYTHAESIKIAEEIEKADILISHDIPFVKNTNNKAHDGLIGLTYYIYKNNIPINLHGHLHNNDIKYLKNGTKVIGVYGCELIKLKCS